jgi:hypothetical protein
MTEVTPHFDGRVPPDANPHHVKSPAGGQVTTADPKFLGDAMSRARGIDRRDTAERLKNV